MDPGRCETNSLSNVSFGRNRNMTFFPPLQHFARSLPVYCDEIYPREGVLQVGPVHNPHQAQHL